MYSDIVKKLDGHMTIDEMISQLDGACGRLIVEAMRNPIVKEAMEMVTEVSIALGEMACDSEVTEELTDY